MLYYQKYLKRNARVLRRNLTEPEKLLWSKIRNKQITNLQWYRQKPIANYIVDFYCPKANLVIEIDGDQHFEKSARIKDEERDKALQSLNLRVLRFGNKDVLENTEGVLMKINQAIKNIPTDLPL